MFSLQTIFGKGDRFYGLLESAAEAAHESTRALGPLVASRGVDSLAEFGKVKARAKAIGTQTSRELIDTFVTALEREDIEALSSALYKIPKTVEKFAERYALVAGKLGDVDFAPRAAMLERACEVIVQMVRQLRLGLQLETMKTLNDQLHAIESEADRLIVELYRDAYDLEREPMQFLMRKDLFEILEKAIDRCRDVGNVVYQIALKNS